MYAVVSTGGKQLKVAKGTEAVVEKLDAAVGDSVTFDVLFVADGENIVVDPGALAAATVTAEVVEHFKADKQIIFKFKKRKGYKRLKGHRQLQTRVVVTDVVMSGAAKPAVKKATKPVAKVAAEPVAVPSLEALSADEVVVAQCEAVKSSGDRCANKPKDGSAYCGVHAKTAGS